jgi:hypothetical protein
MLRILVQLMNNSDGAGSEEIPAQKKEVGQTYCFLQSMDWKNL